jgi:hypothetical protein
MNFDSRRTIMPPRVAHLPSASSRTVISNGAGQTLFFHIAAAKYSTRASEKPLFSVRECLAIYKTVPFGKAAGDFAAGKGACSSTLRA